MTAWNETIGPGPWARSHPPQPSPLKDADPTLVELRTYPACGDTLYPACKLHGAMNQLTSEGIWRCLATYELWEDAQGKHFKENACKAGCIYEP